MMTAPYQRLAAWREGRALVGAVYRETARWPADERYGLTAQMRRAAVSVVLNLAEGMALHGPRGFRRHTAIALGSLAELECGLALAADLGFRRQPSAGLDSQLRRTASLVWRLHRSLGKNPC